MTMAGTELSPDVIAEENRNATDLVADDVEVRGGDAVSREAPEAAEAPESRGPVVGSPFADKRKAIYDKAKRNREPAEGESEFISIPPEREKEFFGERVETRGDREARRATERGEVVQPPVQHQEQSQPPAKRKLTVNGREVEVDDKEVVALAQQAMAAGNILDVAKGLKRELEQSLDEVRKARQHPAEPEEASTTREAPQGHQLADAELDDIIDKIQVGDPSQAKEALAKYGASIEQRIIDRIGDLKTTIADQVTIVNESNSRRHETLTTLRTFGEENPEFQNSPALQAALATETTNTMRNRMFDIGVTEESLDRIKTEHKFSDTEAIGYAYRTLKLKGYDLPDHGAVLSESAESLRKQFGMQPRPQPTSETRQQQFDPSQRDALKREIITQPRRANVPPNADTQERTREEARLSAVRQMRAARRGRA